MLSRTTFALLLGFLLDALLGDPEGVWHPVRAIGWLITSLEGVCRRIFPKTPRGERAAGVCLALLVLTGTGTVTALILQAAYSLGTSAGFLVETVLCFWLIAAKSLREESTKVREALKEGLSAGRRAVSRIVGRDVERLDEKGVIRAAVETVAENTSDGVMAPILYTAAGGPVLGFLYKCVNTMDSMVGYQNDRYRNFGWAAAKLDDLLNFIPARLSGLLMILAAPLSGLDGRGAAEIFRRDRKKHKSPNAGCTEAAMAGALGVQLAGDAWYFGERCRKETIGDPLREIEEADIARANRLMNITARLGLLVCVGVRAGVTVCISMAGIFTGIS